MGSRRWSGVGSVVRVRRPLGGVFRWFNSAVWRSSDFFKMDSDTLMAASALPFR